MITEEMAVKAYRAWHGAWTEMEGYFGWVASQQTFSGYVMAQHGPGGQVEGWRTRTTYKYTSAANTMFQGICADGAKYAGWLLAKECYTDRDSVLFGARPVLFIHDEYIIECDEARAEECGDRLAEIMVEGMRAFIPDVKIEADPEVLDGPWKK